MRNTANKRIMVIIKRYLIAIDMAFCGFWVYDVTAVRPTNCFSKTSINAASLGNNVVGKAIYLVVGSKYFSNAINSEKVQSNQT